MEIEFSRLTLIYVHLIACCSAIGLILMSDIAMVKQLIGADRHVRTDSKHLNELQTIVSVSLIALWITGAGIVALDASIKGWDYFANPKLQAKVTVVCLLTINGILLHRRVLPLMEKTGSLLNMSLSQCSLALLAGSVSAVSWFYAALLGVGRALSWKYSLTQILAAYPVLIAGGFVSMMMLVAWAYYRTTPHARSFETTRFVGAH
jgi:uncharacterized membrane protein